MSKYDELLPYKKENAERRLQAFRSELRPLTATIKGYSQLILHRSENDENIDIPDEFKEWIEKILVAAQDIDELREILL